MNKPKITIEQFAKLFGVTLEQCRELQLKNREQLTEMYNQACRTGKKVNGYTSEQLRQLVTGLQIPDAKPLWRLEEFSGCFIVYGPNGCEKEFCGQGYHNDKARAEKFLARKIKSAP